MLFAVLIQPSAGVPMNLVARCHPLLARLAAAAALTAVATVAAAQTKWDLPAAYPGDQLPHREPAAVRQRRRQGERRQAQDHRARQRVAVQGQRDQARGPGRPGADRRGAARQLREREPDLRRRRHSVPRRQLPRVEEARRGAEAVPRQAARRAGNDAALHRAVAAAGHLRQEGDRLGRRHARPEVARLQPGHRARSPS